MIEVISVKNNIAIVRVTIKARGRVVQEELELEVWYHEDAHQYKLRQAGVQTLINMRMPAGIINTIKLELGKILKEQGE